MIRSPLAFISTPVRILRCLLHLCLLVLLGAAVSWLWKNAWTTLGGVPPVLLEPGPKPAGKSLRAPGNVNWNPVAGHLTFRANPGGPFPSHEFLLDGWARGRAAHIRIAGTTRDLDPGPEEWQDGRAMLIWRQPDGSVQQAHYGLLGSEGSSSFDLEFLAILNQPGQPSVFLQHAGTSGELTIEKLKITPVGLRPWVPIVTAAILVSVTLWWAVLLSLITEKRNLWRSFCAALITVLAFWVMVLPGPWEPLRPLGGAFVIGSGVEVASATPAASPPSPGGGISPAARPAPPKGDGAPSAVAGPPAPVAQPPARSAEEKPKDGPALDAPETTPVPGAMKQSWFWESYHWVKRKARVLLHIGVFAGLTLALVGISRSDRGWVPVALLGVSSEAMQAFFGFGFEWEDVGDLTVNGLGIAIALAVARWWTTRQGRGRELANP